MRKLILLFIVFFNFLQGVDSFSAKEGLDGTKANLYNGAISEHISTSIYKKNGYTQINAEVGRNGVDGLFLKRDVNGNIQKVVFSEVKHGKGKLGTIDKGNIEQMSKAWKLDKINKKITSLEKLPKNTKLNKQIEDLTIIREMVSSDSKKVKSQITRITNLGDGKYSIALNGLVEDEAGKMKLGKRLKHQWQDNIIDINAKHYKPDSDAWKIQKVLKHSARKQKRLVKETKRLKELVENQKKFSKNSKRYKNYITSIEKQESLIKQINRSRPNILSKIDKTPKLKVPAIIRKKGDKVLAFMDAKMFKKASKMKNLKFLKNVKGGDVVMMALEGGIAVYTVLHGGMTYKKISSLLVDTGKNLAGEGFSKGIAMLTPPPATLVVIATIAGTILIEYAIDKYIEIDKRGYIGLEDMLWDVPDEIKNKITVLNLEDTKNETVFDFSNIDKETILDEEESGESILENNDVEKETILD